MSLRNVYLFAVVEIGSQWVVLVLAVFVITFAVVAGALLWVLRRGKSGPQDTTTWQFDTTGRLPVGKRTFDNLAGLTEELVAPPAVSPETRQFVESLKPVRDTLATSIRVILIAAGLGGIAIAIALFRQADSSNMMGLPAGIVLLISLGALLSGLIPSRTIDPVKPLDRELLQKIRVQVSKQPLTINLTSSDLAKAAEIMRQGASLEEVARSIYPDYDALGRIERAAVQQALAQAVKI
jgi:hypothetical protein